MNPSLIISHDEAFDVVSCGIRFTKDHEKVEVAIGVPCNQVLIVFHENKETKWWGGTLGNTATQKALKLLPHKRP